MTISYIIEMYFLYLKIVMTELIFYRKKGEGPLSNFASGPMISLAGPDHRNFDSYYEIKTL